MSKWEEFIYPERAKFIEGWENESAFDTWLVSSDGLKFLLNATGIEIDPETVQQQASVGLLSADIFAKDTDGAAVIIENQQGKADHDHLGKLLAYAGGLASEGACRLVWIAEEIRDEFRAALNWQINRTNVDVSFFGIEAGLLRANDLLIPDLKVVCEPNNWSRVGKKFASGKSDARSQNLLNFWARLLDEFSKQGIITYRKISPSADNWLDAGAGVPLCPWRLTRSTSKMRVALVIATAEKEVNDFLFSRIKESKEQIEEDFGDALIWHSETGQKSNQIYFEKSIENGFDSDCWDSLIDWTATHFERLEAALKQDLINAKKALNRQPQDQA